MNTWIGHIPARVESRGATANLGVLSNDCHIVACENTATTAEDEQARWPWRVIRRKPSDVVAA